MTSKGSSVARKAGLIDAAVHPNQVGVDDLRQFMREPYRRIAFPGPIRFLYPVPTDEPIGGAFTAEARGEAGLPGSDPELLRAFMKHHGIERAVLAPLGRGLNPNLDLTTEICRATNTWLAETWLGAWNREERFLGSIRVNPEDPEAAIEEIERWAGDPRMVQVAVPLEAHRPYGQRLYAPLWEAAARHGLPVAIHSDGGAGTDFPPTVNGYPRSFIEYDSMVSLNFIFHLASFIAEGVFERVAGLRVIFGDGGHDALMPFMWRMNTDWPITGIEVPWVTRQPSDYLPDHVRFVTSGLEGPPSGADQERWASLSAGAELLVYGSHYPQWRLLRPSQVAAELPAEAAERVLTSNAAGFLRLPGEISASLNPSTPT